MAYNDLPHRHFGFSVRLPLPASIHSCYLFVFCCTCCCCFCICSHCICMICLNANWHEQFANATSCHKSQCHATRVTAAAVVTATTPTSLIFCCIDLLADCLTAWIVLLLLRLVLLLLLILLLHAPIPCLARISALLYAKGMHLKLHKFTNK